MTEPASVSPPSWLSDDIYTLSVHVPVAGTGPGFATVNVTLARASIRPEDGTMMSPTARSGRSTSETFKRAVALLKPLADAVMIVGWMPSFNPSETPFTVKAALLWPLRIVTVGAAGWDSPGSSLVRLTTSAPAVPVLRLTVPVTAPVSATTSRASVSVSEGPSLSNTCNVAIAWPFVMGAPVAPRMRAIKSFVRVPFTKASSVTLMLNNASPAPAGIVSSVGISNRPGSVWPSCTVSAKVNGGCRLRMPDVAGLSAPSTTAAAAKSKINVGASLSITVISALPD